MKEVCEDTVNTRIYNVNPGNYFRRDFLQDQKISSKISD